MNSKTFSLAFMNADIYIENLNFTPASGLKEHTCVPESVRIEAHQSGLFTPLQLIRLLWTVVIPPKRVQYLWPARSLHCMTGMSASTSTQSVQAITSIIDVRYHTQHRFNG